MMVATAQSSKVLADAVARNGRSSQARQASVLGHRYEELTMNAHVSIDREPEERGQWYVPSKYVGRSDLYLRSDAD